MSEDSTLAHDRQSARDAHRALGLWSMRRALALAFGGAVGLLVAGWFFVSWLLGSPSKAPPQPLDTKAQLDLLKLVFALVAGAGALVALVTAYRRQRVEEAAGERAERAQAHAEHDATERRVTELYGQAVEQLGHPNAAVRLGGLYSLERLGQDHPQHRQTVIDVVCAYLRMAFQPPASTTAPNTQPRPDEPTDDTPPAASSADIDTQQELQVRLTAQRLLNRHLTKPATPYANDQNPSPLDVFWDGMLINLTGAHLVDFDFSQCHAYNIDLRNAQFHGEAWFAEARFLGNAEFDKAKFHGDAWFTKVRFHRNAGFGNAQFHGDAWFDTAQFDEDAEFDEAQFHEGAGFEKAQFRRVSRFAEVQFYGNAWFAEAKVHRAAWFREAQFHKSAGFEKAQFHGDAWFDTTQFHEDAWFMRAQFHEGAIFMMAQFHMYARFIRAQFHGNAIFIRAQFHGNAGFDEIQFSADPDFTDATASRPKEHDRIWPDHWQEEPHPTEAEMAVLVRRQ